MTRSGWRARALWYGGVALLLLSWPATAQDAADTFRQNCASCHTIGGGRLTGPDLKDVAKRRDRAWLTQFIPNPQALIATGDTYAADLVQQARGVVMPTLPGIDAAKVTALLDLIDAESALPESKFKGLAIPDAPFTAADIAAGEALFLGRHKLLNGGPPCFSCHTIQGLPALGGGRLGPDLTKVFERIPGRKPLAGWLQAPATPLMGSVFKPHPIDSKEILPLVAFFEAAAQRSGPADALPLLKFLLAGLAGCVLALLAFDGIWRRRFRSVRRALIQQATGRMS